ncbi:hypothetical protein ACOME3_000435 [Neoechinorhynchus agilis]
MSNECSLAQTSNVLSYIASQKIINSYDYALEHSIDHQKVIGILKSLSCRSENFLKTEQKTKKFISLTEQGLSFLENGSYEYRIWQALDSDTGIEFQKLKDIFPEAKFGVDKAMRAGWIKNEKGIATRASEHISDSTTSMLSSVQSNPSSVSQKEIKELMKRKLVSESTLKYLICTPGEGFTLNFEKSENDLTEELISSGRWRDVKFREYNLKAKGIEPVKIGALHPLQRMRSCVREIFLELGFEEMPTDRYVESSFWNFDALFQPQEHPARDQQDTFFVSEPAESAQDWPDWYQSKVDRVHSQGEYGSIGYQSKWKVEEARRNILRTHTTAISARMLFKLATEKPFRPAKYFSIDRVFRNETQDATHLAEFHQVEGLIADRNLTLGHLIGTIKQFYDRIGLKNLRFKPAYNPYTEPSMEIFCYHEGLGKLIEVGNSGMFRPEMLLPMGLPEDVRVIAWGLSLERPTMIKLGISNIRELVGHRVDLQMCKNSPFIFFSAE